MPKQRWARVVGTAITETRLGDKSPGAIWSACPDECTTAWQVTVEGAFLPPGVTPVRLLRATAFRDLFTAAERIAMRAADPRLADGEMKAMTQGEVNLASTECAQLMALAVAKGALTRARADAVLAGQSPE